MLHSTLLITTPSGQSNVNAIIILSSLSAIEVMWKECCYTENVYVET